MEKKNNIQTFGNRRQREYRQDRHRRSSVLDACPTSAFSRWIRWCNRTSSIHDAVPRPQRSVCQLETSKSWFSFIKAFVRLTKQSAPDIGVGPSLTDSFNLDSIAKFWNFSAHRKPEPVKNWIRIPARISLLGDKTRLAISIPSKCSLKVEVF